MAILEALDPEFVRLLIEQISLYLSSMRYLSSFIIFDDSSRLITRVGYIDDGYVRIRDAQDTSISIVEILREMTWTSLSLAQLGATTAQPGDQPPPNVIVTGGFDGSLVRMLKTDSDGRLQVGVVSLPVTKGDWLSVIPNPPNLDVALSTRASEATLVAIRDRLPASLTSAGNFRVAVLEDGIGLAKDSTLSSILSRLDTNLSTRASETTLSGIKSQTDKLTFDASNRLIVNATVVANLDRSLLTVKRELLTLAPASGRNATVPVDDYVHWIDSAEYSVTETSWTEKTRCVVRQRNLPSRTYLVHVYVEGYVSAGQTLYVRFRSLYRGTLASFTFTETSYVSKEANATYIAPGWWDDPIYVEAYVTGGTGYVKNAQINFVKANVVEGWTGTISGEQFKPVRVDSDGYLQVRAISTANPPNLDVALSTRASESTLVAVKDRLPISLTTSGNFKVAILEDSVGLAKSSDLANLANLDVALSYLWKLLRWGRNVEPSWVHGDEVTAPTAGTALVSKTVSTGKAGYIYGFFISAGEANDFLINWTSGGAAYSIRIPFGGRGALQYIDFTPINEGLPADAGSSITITNVDAGSAGIVYQARLLYAEV